jgi:hypothetical protein
MARDRNGFRAGADADGNLRAGRQRIANPHADAYTHPNAHTNPDADTESQSDALAIVGQYRHGRRRHHRQSRQQLP